MNFSLITEYPWYFLLLCLLAGAGFAWLAYRKNNISQKEKWYSWPVWLLMLLRFISVTLLSFLLLGPVVKSLFKKVEKPVIIIAQDNSKSILLSRDSAFYKNELPNKINELTNELSKKYDLRSFSFDSEVHDLDPTKNQSSQKQYSGKQTDISNLYEHIYQAFYNQNIGAVITLTDGIYNQGQNPLFSAEKINAPFYTVALGDTQPRNDVLIKDVQYNQVVYAGNFFPLQIGIRAKGYGGKNVTVNVSNKGKTVFTQNVNLQGNTFYTEVPARIEANSPGLQHYRVTVTQLPNEISYVNNSFDLFVEVLESRKKILLISAVPHPDISAIKNSIERNAQYEVSNFLYNDAQKNALFSASKLKNYQLAILHQLPASDQNASPLITALKEAETPILYIIGSKSALSVFNTLDAGISIQGQGNKLNESGAYLNNAFSYFTISETLDKNLQQWPPLYSPFGEYKGAEPQNVLLWQQIGRVKSQIPLLQLGSASAKQKTGILAGEGIWKWFLYDYSVNENYNASDEILNKTIQYLSVKTDSRPFRVRPARNMFFEDEKVLFEAEAYNQSFEPLQNAVITMRIKNPEGKNFEFTFQPRGNGYILDAGFLPAGVYSYTASTKIGEKPYQLSGEFIVKKIELEFLETEANHQLLNALASQQGGKMIYPNHISDLPKMLEAREDIQPVAYMQTDFRDLIHFKGLFFVLFIALCVEWFLRKYFGSY